METFLQLSRKPGPDVNCVMCHQPLTITQCTHTQSGSPMSQRCPIPGCLIQHRWYRPVMWPCVTMCLSLCRVIASSLAPFKHLTPLTGTAVSPAITGTIGINTEIWDGGTPGDTRGSVYINIIASPELWVAPYHSYDGTCPGHPEGRASHNMQIFTFSLNCPHQNTWAQNWFILTNCQLFCVWWKSPYLQHESRPGEYVVCIIVILAGIRIVWVVWIVNAQLSLPQLSIDIIMSEMGKGCQAHNSSFISDQRFTSALISLVPSLSPIYICTQIWFVCSGGVTRLRFRPW